ncbi:fasciclin domain-containing protein [Parerythrobacter jejuensis]|uniref:Fasciclin domain-containing protein n=1 Tax=Parerythrobacter jejuensis TaxID=795812 RepID=A0A845AP89_9SPHN|nr:fasciclin domain-containing protein [Parerythrobacter jejuensis]MXP30316.1 fasciclin domain-containing protein [Parerythrobacter jejuensis]MXP33076.1 fasciclin domain-containing protein [Parerythrobacter jejuensis]
MKLSFNSVKASFVATASALALVACGAPADGDTEDAMADGTTAAAEEPGTIVAVAQGNDDFSTLVTAVTAAELGETLSGEGPFTVFAPTNAAFAKLPEGTLESLTAPEGKEQLTGILTYHVVSGATDAATLTSAIESNNGSFEITTVNGGALTASIVDGNVVLTDAAGGTSTVTATDVKASNGIIHAIDTVVMPG